ncbi:Mu transposase C-terminal domain-containing protein [Helicobacter winghamensis]|uniref:Mu transposase C-terminal domain-containing protein n=1 Tax=Helicobacter winghamensis TaxID=157268 RepID=UPI00351AC545
MWINVNEFCMELSIGLRNIQKKAKQAYDKGQKIFYIDTKIFSYKYILNNRGGHAGKILQIWSKPLSKEEASLIEQGFSIEDISSTQHSYTSELKIHTNTLVKQPLGGLAKELNNGEYREEIAVLATAHNKERDIDCSNTPCKQEIATNPAHSSNDKREALSSHNSKEEDSLNIDKNPYNEKELTLANNNLSLFAASNHKKQDEALLKSRIVKEWQKAKGSLSCENFIFYINSKKLYPFKLSANKLYTWQRDYLKMGLDGLVDKRTNTKENELTRLGIYPLFESLLLAQKGRINVSNVHRLINYEVAKKGDLELKDFLGKKDEFISYECVLRATKKYLKDNKLVKDIILYGEDGAISRHLPALGVSNWRVSSVNEIVEIDASPLDAICKVDLINEKFHLKGEECEWHKRYTIISLIDTYSGVVSFYLGYAEDSLSIARAIAKYISTYGVPKCIHSDNGKAFLSKNTKALLERLSIDYKAMRAYSGWAKPYVENKFKALQNELTANLVGYIGANVKERQAIEFFYSKKERRLKKGYKTNQRRLKTLSYMQKCIDTFSQYFLNNTYLDRLGTTPKAAYEAKLEDVKRIDEISLSIYLGGALEIRKVLNKGISLNNNLFYNPKLYNYESVYVCANLNRANEIFCFDESKELICVASSLDLEIGVSVEEAKEARKIMQRSLKHKKDAIDKNRLKLESDMEKYLKLGEEKLQKTALAPLNSANNAKAELEYSSSLISNGEIEKYAKKRKEKQEKEPSYDWHRAALKAKKA